jgi:hypothetical protein
MPERIDWEYWRHRFITGSNAVTLKVLSHEPNAPQYSTIKNRASKEDWTDQRKRFRKETTTRAVTIEPSAQKVAEAAEAIIDMAEMLTRHANACKLVGSRAIARMKNIDPNELSPDEALRLLKWAIETERLTEGLATARQEVDLTSLSDAELEKIVNGD